MSDTITSSLPEVRAKVSHSVVAERLSTDKSTVSRLRTGDRSPSLIMMERMRSVFGWTPNSQLKAWFAGRYNHEFEAILVKEYGAED